MKKKKPLPPRPPPNRTVYYGPKWLCKSPEWVKNVYAGVLATIIVSPLLVLIVSKIIAS